jgi:hypothetical protein
MVSIERKLIDRLKEIKKLRSELLDEKIKIEEQLGLD